MGAAVAGCAVSAGAQVMETDYIPKVAARAWRWAPELEEAAEALAAAGLPDAVLHSSAQTLRRWEEQKDNSGLTVEQALRALSSTD